LLASGYWLLASGHWLLVSGRWLLASGHWLLVSGHWLLVAGRWSARPARLAGVEPDPTFYSEFRIPNSKFKSLWLLVDSGW
jgi:hypothetical protein